MPTFTVTDSEQIAGKGGRGWKRARIVTMSGDGSTYQATGFAVTTAQLLFPATILGFSLLATSGTIGGLYVYFDYANTSIRMTTAGVEFGLGNSTAFTTGNIIKLFAWGT